jgi:hypothetical protein
LDSSGKSHISYQDYSNGSLKYASQTGAAWSIQVVDSSPGVGAYSSLALDSNDYPHISYQDGSDPLVYPGLGYAEWNGTAWNTAIISSGAVGFYTSLALDSAGNPHISYMNGKVGGLFYASSS